MQDRQEAQAAGLPIDSEKMAKIRKTRPGRAVPLGDTGVDARVLPAKWRDVGAVIELLAESRTYVQQALEAVEAAGGDDTAMMFKLVQIVAQFPRHRVLAIVQPSVDVDLAELDFDLIPPVLAAWIQESFGEGKLKGWAGLGKTLTTMLPTAPSQAS